MPASCQRRARKVRARHGASTTFEVGLTKRRMEKFCSFSKGQCLKASRPLRNRNSEMVLNSCKVQQYLQEVTILNEKHNTHFFPSCSVTVETTRKAWNSEDKGSQRRN